MPPDAHAPDSQAYASRQGSVERSDLVSNVKVDASDGGDVQQEDQRADAVGDESSEN